MDYNRLSAGKSYTYRIQLINNIIIIVLALHNRNLQKHKIQLEEKLEAANSEIERRKTWKRKLMELHKSMKGT